MQYCTFNVSCKSRVMPDCPGDGSMTCVAHVTGRQLLLARTNAHACNNFSSTDMAEMNLADIQNISYRQVLLAGSTGNGMQFCDQCNTAFIGAIRPHIPLHLCA